MKIGIFSDIHGNIEALSAVMASYDALPYKIDFYACLGDTVGYGASPNECVKIVKERTRFNVIGNHDCAVVGKIDYSYYYDAAKQALDWHAAVLKQEYHEWLAEIPFIVHHEDMTFCHGSPIRPEDFDYVFNTHQATALLEDYDSLRHITFIGHSHLTKAFELTPTSAVDVTGDLIKLDKDKKYVVTVGSVGQPRDNDNRACHCVYDTEESTITYFRTHYDVRASANKIFESSLSNDFAKRLFFGI